MADEMAQNQLRELLVEFEGRLNQRFDQIDERFNQIDERFNQVDERFNQVDQRLAGLESGQHSLEAAVASMDTRLSARIAELSHSVAEQSHSMTVQFEKSHANMKLGLQAVQILEARMDRRFNEEDARLQEQVDLLKAVARR